MEAQLKRSEKVTFVTRLRSRDVLICHTRDGELVSSLVERGARAVWFDRELYSTRKGAEPNMQAEVTLGPRFFQEAP